MKKKFKNSLHKMINYYTQNHLNININDKGEVTNWKQLNPLAKEDYLEDEFNNIDFSKSTLKFPALHLLKTKGSQYLVNLEVYSPKGTNFNKIS